MNSALQIQLGSLHIFMRRIYLLFYNVTSRFVCVCVGTLPKVKFLDSKGDGPLFLGVSSQCNRDQLFFKMTCRDKLSLY